MEVLDIFRPKTIDEVKNLLVKYQNCILLAGGTDLLIDIKNGKKSGEYIIDLGNIKGLTKIKETRKEIILGSMVKFKDLCENKLIRKYYNSLYNCAKLMGSPQIRNSATIGGNIVNGAPAADLTPCLISLDALLFIESPNYERVISCEQYFMNYEKEKIKPDEILTKIIIPKKKSLNGFYKLGKRNSLSIARINCAVRMEVKKNKIESLALCLGAVGRYPFRVEEVEKICMGKTIDYLFSEDVLERLENIVYESIKTRASMPFKKEAVKGVFKRTIENAFGGVI